MKFSVVLALSTAATLGSKDTDEWFKTFGPRKVPSTQSEYITEFDAEMLVEHNRCRRRHGAPDLELSLDSRRKAQLIARNLVKTERLVVERQRLPLQFHGENMFVSTRNVTAHEVVKVWYDESKYYDRHRPAFTKNAEHFTQLIWKSTTHVGCGQATSWAGLTYTVCHYSPAGNVEGQFKLNVEP